MLQHKAFIFDSDAFAIGLGSILAQGLSTSDNSGLVEFVNDNIAKLVDPYEGRPLTEDWQNLLETPDAHQYGDFALTKFYDPAADIGLGQDWQPVMKVLSLETPRSTAIVLGQAFGPTGNYFDPGKLGSYFQSAEDVRRNLSEARSIEAYKPGIGPRLSGLLDILQQASEAGMGLYVTL